MLNYDSEKGRHKAVAADNDCVVGRIFPYLSTEEPKHSLSMYNNY